MEGSTEKEDQWDTASAILNILLKNPKEFELLTKPSAIRENKLFTVNSNNMSLESVKRDDNGSYLSKGTAEKFYYWESDKEEPSRSAHLDKINQTWLIVMKMFKLNKTKYMKFVEPTDKIRIIPG